LGVPIDERGAPSLERIHLSWRSVLFGTAFGSKLGRRDMVQATSGRWCGAFLSSQQSSPEPERLRSRGIPRREKRKTAPGSCLTPRLTCKASWRGLGPRRLASPIEAPYGQDRDSLSCQVQPMLCAESQLARRSLSSSRSTRLSVASSGSAEDSMKVRRARLIRVW